MRAADGTLQEGDLSPDAAQHIKELPVSGEARRDAYQDASIEGAIGVRCIRRTILL